MALKVYTKIHLKIKNIERKHVCKGKKIVDKFLECFCRDFVVVKLDEVLSQVSKLNCSALAGFTLEQVINTFMTFL